MDVQNKWKGEAHLIVFTMIFNLFFWKRVSNRTYGATLRRKLVSLFCHIRIYNTSYYNCPGDPVQYEGRHKKVNKKEDLYQSYTWKEKLHNHKFNMQMHNFNCQTVMWHDCVSFDK